MPAGVLTAGTWDDNLNFDRFETFRASVAQLAGLPVFDEAEQSAARARTTVRGPKLALDLALVIDTTGSMGDEIRYLQAEFLRLAQTLVARAPNVSQRWALIEYRDDGDKVPLRAVDFVTNASAFQAALDPLQAMGGGDFPEAPDRALDRAATLSWDGAPSTARVLFWVADAPHHAQAAHALVAAVRGLAAKDVHVYPIASSGIDELTEYAMRATAQLTLGRYLFLTDDSGVGGSHKTPSIACYHVTRLDAAIARALDSELSGVTPPIDPASVLRAVGAPANGQCALEEGQLAYVF